MANKLLAASVPKTLCTSAIFLYDLCFSLLLVFLSWQNAKYENKIIVKLFCRRLQFFFLVFFNFEFQSPKCLKTNRKSVEMMTNHAAGKGGGSGDMGVDMVWEEEVS